MFLFQKMYEDELLYSVIARYHRRSGNICYAHTTIDIYGRKTVRSSVYLPSNISNLVSNLHKSYDITEEDIILNYTLYPFYTSFLSEEKSQKILELMKQCDGTNIYNRMGICASPISTPLYLKFCPECLREDTDKYGEPYWHRIHQVPGIKICPKHKSILEDSTVKINSFCKQEYIAASHKNCIINYKINYSQDIIEKLYNLAKDIEYLLNVCNKKREYDWYRNNYLNYLKKRELATPKGKVRSNKLILEFKEFYGDEFLDLVESNIEVGSKRNWLNNIYTARGDTTHPIRQLLFIRYLGVSIDDIFNYSYEFKPFGYGPWPCLNKVCNHYKEDVIQNISIKYSQATHRITGTLKCECGYTYLKEYNVNNDNKYGKTKVLKFGPIWEKKLTNLVIENELTIQNIADQLGLDWVSLYKQIIKLNLEPNFKTTSKRIKKYKNRAKSDDIANNYEILKNNKIYTYRQELLEILKKYPEKSRTEIKLLNRKLYVYLQKNDRDWLESELPPRRKGYSIKSTVDWNKRDYEILEMVKSFVENFNKGDERPKWINLNIIGKSLNIYTVLQKHLDRLPNTKKYLSDVIESRDEHRIQKIRWAINFIVEKDDGKLNMTRVALKAGVSVKEAKWKNIIVEEIKNYRQQ